MNERRARSHRSKVEIDIDDAANLVRAQANPDTWLQYEPPVKIGTRAKLHLMSWGLEVKESASFTWVRWSSGQLFPAPVEVAPVPLMAKAKWDAYDVLKAELIAAGLNENCLTCRFNRNWECRRHAPLAAENGFADWAKVEPEDWCGEYQDIEVHGP